MSQLFVLKENLEMVNISIDTEKNQDNESTLVNRLDDNLIEKDFESDAFPRSFKVNNNGEKMTYALQESLFHKVCPTLYFGHSHEQSKHFGCHY